MREQVNSKIAPIRWKDLRSPELDQLAENDAIVLLPVGAIEQHGPHLPVETDSRLAEEISLRAAEMLNPNTLTVVAPTVWCGLSEHHMGYAGTISIRYETFAAILRDVCDTIQRHGFSKIMIVNGHGGNVAALKVIVGVLSRELAHPVYALTYCHLDTCATGYADVLEDQKNVLHAGEAETSMMLVLTPDRIDGQSMSDAPNKCFDFASDREIYRFYRFDELSETGVNGVTKNASRAKGEALLQIGAKAVAEALSAEFGQNCHE